MKITNNLTDQVVLTELGERLAQRRIELQLTQSDLAGKAGVSKRTVERVEAGHSAQLESILRIFRTLNLLEGLENLLPEVGPTPLELLKRQGKKRQRASSRRKEKAPRQPWVWGEDANKRTR